MAFPPVWVRDLAFECFVSGEGFQAIAGIDWALLCPDPVLGLRIRRFPACLTWAACIRGQCFRDSAWGKMHSSSLGPPLPPRL